jgi:hypothetical protein
MHIQRMQKALTLMNVQIHRAITDITGTTGLRIIRDIVSGNHDPERLAEHRDYRCHAPKAEIIEALRGEYQVEQLFCLRQELAMYDAYQGQIEECDREVAAAVERLARTAGRVELPPEAPRKAKSKKLSKQFRLDVREPLARIANGVDLTKAHGIAELTALRIIAEIGTDVSCWPTAKHFVSWTTLAPSCRISGGKAHSSRRPASAHRVAEILRMAASTIVRTQSALGAFYRRLAARSSKGKAIVATAAKIARTIYSMMKNGSAYQDPGADAYEQAYKERALRNLERRAADFGFALTPIPSDLAPAVAVS